MEVIVVGDFTNDKPLLVTKKATSLYINCEDGTPAVIYKLLPNGKGYIRLTRGEDKDFDDFLRQSGLK